MMFLDILFPEIRLRDWHGKLTKQCDCFYCVGGICRKWYGKTYWGIECNEVISCTEFTIIRNANNNKFDHYEPSNFDYVNMQNKSILQLRLNISIQQLRV